MALTKITPQMFDTSAAGHDFNIDNGTFVVDASANRVGIGTTTPSNTLDVVGGFNLAGNIFVDTNVLATDVANNRVGIGTATPSTLLDVNGTATATTFVGALTGNVTGNVTGTILTAAQTNITSVGTLTSLTTGDVTISSSAGTLTLVDSDGTQQNTIIKQSGGNVFIQARDNTNNAGIVFGGNGGGSFDEHMRILPSGNVGIGEVTPTAPLHIDAAGMGDIYSGRIENTTTDTDHYNVVRWIQGASGSAIGMIGTGGSATSNTAFRNTFVVGTQNSTNLVFATNDTQRVSIDGSNGNVTVTGSLTAQNVIDISTDSTAQTTSARQWATIKNTGTGTGDYSEMKISNDNDDYLIMGSIGSGYTNANWANSSYMYTNRELRLKSNQGIRFYSGGVTHGTNDYMILESAGNLGIGITSGISSKLHVNAEMSLGPDANNRGIIGYGSNILSFGTRQSSTNYFSTVKITSGQVGIGTTPATTLDVDGILQLRGSGYATYATRIYTRLDSTHASVIESYLNSNTAFEMMGTYADSGGSNPRIVIGAGGQKVGIGTTNPSATLDIVGGGTSTSPTLELNSSTSNGFNHAINAFNSNLTAGENHIYIIGKEGSTKNSGYIGYKWNGAGSNTNLLTFGHWANDNIMNLTADGKLGIGTQSPISDLFISHAGSGWRTSHGSTNLYVKNSGTNFDPQFYYGAPQGIVVSVDSSNTTGPDKQGLVLYNNDTTAGGFSPMLTFAKSESGSTPYKAAMAAIYAKSPLGTGNSDSWIDGELVFATAGAATSGVTAQMVLDKEGRLYLGKANFANRSVAYAGRYWDVDGTDYYTKSSGNGYHFYDTSNYKFYVNANGGVYNYATNNYNLSDERVKKNIEPLESQWAKVKLWNLKKFHLKTDDDSDSKRYGVIAQDVEIHNPEVVDNFMHSDTETRKAVKEQQLTWLAIKALQEAMERIETLEAEVKALKGE